MCVRVCVYVHVYVCVCSLTRVLSESPSLQGGEYTSSQKAVFLFLQLLYSNCSYLQATFRSSFTQLRVMIGESVLVESFSPCTTEGEWQKLFLGHVSKPSECNVPKLCAAIKSAHYPRIYFCFAVDVFYTACQRNVTWYAVVKELPFLQ